MIRLALQPDGQTVASSLAEFLGPDRFGAYREACAEVGARWDPSTRTNRLPVEAVPSFLAALAKRALPCAPDARIADMLRAKADEARALLDAGRERLQACRGWLAEQGKALWRYQETGVEWIAPRRRALLGDEMGLGKTVQALIALPQRAAALIVLPKAVRYNWATEIQTWRPDLRPVLIDRADAFRYPRPGEAVLVTYGLLPDEDQPPTPRDVVHLIADEAHAVKGKTKRTKRFRALADAVLAHEGSVWLLTGTPLLNRPPELWSVLAAAGLAEEAFGSWRRFASLFNGRRGRYGYEWGEASAEVPDLLRRVMLRRRRSEVLVDLPAKIRRDVEVNGLDRATIAACDAVIALLEERGMSLDALAFGVSATKVHGAAFEQMSRARALLASAKIPAMLELVEEYESQDEPLVVFSAHRAPVEVLGKREGWAVILGDTPADERGRIVEEFQAGRLKGVAGTIAAMGVGVTLTRAAHVLLVDLAWTPALNSQAEDRCCRIGQTRGVVVTRLIARHALDARVAELLTEKQVLIESSVEASAVEADHVAPSPAEALLQQAQVAQQAAEEGARRHEALRREAEEQRLAQVRETIQRLGGAYDGRDVRVRGRLRSAANEVEAHAARALILLAGMDPDRARVVNGAGFSKYDGDFGHSLATQLAERDGMLTDKQWAAACRLANKYRRQVGPPPSIGESLKAARFSDQVVVE